METDFLSDFAYKVYLIEKLVYSVPGIVNPQFDVKAFRLYIATNNLSQTAEHFIFYRDRTECKQKKCS